MDHIRKIAVIVGALYIIATVAGIIAGFVFLGSILDDPDYLTKASENESQVIIGAFFFFVMAVAVAAIAVVIYPILRKHNEVLALGFAGARIVEGVLFVISIIIILTLLTLSQEFVEAGSPDASYFQTLGTSLMSAGDWTETVFAGLVFTLSALMLNYVLYQSRLVPRWLSGWGLIGAILYPVAAISLFGSTTSSNFYAPLAVQEMVFATWLIVKGFNPSAISPEPAKASEGPD